MHSLAFLQGLEDEQEGVPGRLEVAGDNSEYENYIQGREEARRQIANKNFDISKYHTKLAHVKKIK